MPWSGLLAVGRGLRRHFDFVQDPIGVAEPEPVALEAGRRIEQRDAVALDARLQLGQIVGIAAEREVMDALVRSFHHAAPAVVVAERVQRERIVLLAHVEAEAGVEALRMLEVRHLKHELVERMDPDGGLIGGRRDIAPNRGHLILPLSRLTARLFIRSRAGPPRASPSELSVRAAFVQGFAWNYLTGQRLKASSSKLDRMG